MARDPVCGMRVDEKRTKLSSERDGMVFYFCSAACKGSFDREPHRYAGS